MVGLRGFEPLTSPLSGVRSNQLSYRPTPLRPAAIPKGTGCHAGREPAQAHNLPLAAGCIRLMKGHEDDGNVLWKPRSSSGG
jgi:hypothetical protein